MQWSKLKSRVKNRICPELRTRVDFHLTSYRHSHDGADKVWITVDGETIFTCKHYRYERMWMEAFFCELIDIEIKSVLREMEVHRPADFGEAMRSYLDLSIQNALTSPDPLIRALAIIDRRVGQRTLLKLEVPATEHSLVKAFYALRSTLETTNSSCT